MNTYTISFLREKISRLPSPLITPTLIVRAIHKCAIDTDDKNSIRLETLQHLLTRFDDFAGNNLPTKVKDVGQVVSIVLDALGKLSLSDEITQVVAAEINIVFEEH